MVNLTFPYITRLFSILYNNWNMRSNILIKYFSEKLILKYFTFEVTIWVEVKTVLMIVNSNRRDLVFDYFHRIDRL